jgi:hypothetical protein
MKRMFILAVPLWLLVSAPAHAQVNFPTNAASTVTGAIEPSGLGATGATGGSSIGAPVVAVPCSFGVSASADLTAFGCASDPLGASTYQIPAETGARAVTMVPTGGTPGTTPGAGGAGGGVSSSARCSGGVIPSTAGGADIGAC